MKLRIAGVDPALNNTGVVTGWMDADTRSYDIDTLGLITTEKSKLKTVRRNSDDLRRAQEIHQFLTEMLTGVDVVFVEVPQGTQSARGAMSNGIVLGILASLPHTLIQVAPTETKKATVGRKDASKEEMIEWATARWPDLVWIRGRGEARYSPRNEHCADACGIVEAGVSLVEFRDYLAIYKKVSNP